MQTSYTHHLLFTFLLGPPASVFSIWPAYVFTLLWSFGKRVKSDKSWGSATNVLYLNGPAFKICPSFDRLMSMFGYTGCTSRLHWNIRVPTKKPLTLSCDVEMKQMMPIHKWPLSYLIHRETCTLWQIYCSQMNLVQIHVPPTAFAGAFLLLT